MSIEPGDFAYISGFIRENSAIVLDPGKEYLVEGRLAPILRDEKLATFTELVGLLKRRPQDAIHQRVLEAMATHETSFFRDITPFESMRLHILPELIKRRSESRTLRIWCGAASSGQEPYSLAMLILEHFPQLAGWDVKIIATDISREILKKCKAGRYGQLEVNRGLPAAMLVKYFDRVGIEWSVASAVRSLVQFEEMNLIRAWRPLPTCDVIFMRNVLIYFDMDVKREILRKVRSVLHPQGYLFLGAAETTLNIDPNYARTPAGTASCYRIAETSAPIARKIA